MNLLEAKLVCKKHPYNNPQQGVCSSCLAEKLSNLSTPCIYHYPNYSLSNSTKAKSTKVGATNHTINYYDDHSNSTGRRVIITSRGGHARHGSDSIDHIGISVGDNINGLKKSRSMIAEFAPRPDMVVKKKGGFLAKLIRSTSKTTKDVLMISSTTDHSRSKV